MFRKTYSIIVICELKQLFSDSGVPDFQRQEKYISFQLLRLRFVQNSWFETRFRTQHSSFREKYLITEIFPKHSHVFVFTVSSVKILNQRTKKGDTETNTFLEVQIFLDGDIGGKDPVCSYGRR